MNCYEIASTVINSLSVVATIFFGVAVFKLSQKANEIAEESNKLQKQEIDKKEKETIKQFNNKILNILKESEKQLPTLDNKETSKK